MDDKTWMSAVSEAKVSADLAFNRFDVFNQETGKAPFDKVVHKDGKILRISVKSVLSSKDGVHYVQLRSIRHNKTKNKIIHFDPESCDYVAVYLFELDKVCYLPSSEIGDRAEVNLRTEPTKFIAKDKRQWLIDDYLNIKLD